MPAATTRRRTSCSLLDADPELADGLPSSQRVSADAACRARLVEVSAGRWDPMTLAEASGSIVGGLLVSGVLLCRTGPERRSGSEVLGAGDLVSPWGSEAAALPASTVWTVLEPMTIAILDEALVGRTLGFPSVLSGLVSRQIRRARTQTMLLAIARHARVEDRLVLLLWLLCDRWGRMTPEGATLELRLTHRVLADLVAAQRQTVSTAMAHLERSGTVLRRPGGFLLRGAPPDELLPGPAG